MKVRVTIISIVLFLIATAVQAQITIGGNVYGGGNKGDTGGNTNVTVYAGDLHNVYAGARQADIEGNTFLHIDGEHASSYIVIDKAYGGNDIAGSIGKQGNVKELRDELTQVTENHITKDWDAFVRVSTNLDLITPATYYVEGDEIPADKSVGDIKTPQVDNNQKIYIGQLFGGGNGEYTYRPLGTRIGGTDAEPVLSTTNDILDDQGVVIASSTTSFVKPDLAKTYLEILGGSIVYAYGGGNNATITDRTVISLKNPSEVVSSIIDATNPNADGTGEVLNNARFEDRMGINTTFSYPSSDEYQIGRLFGGNNKADMAIRPRWNLQEGKVRNLYGGGNEGRMTSPEGLLLQIEGAGMVVDNVYGGCRKADVRPLYNGDDDTPVAYEDVKLDPSDNPNNIPAGYAARVRVLAGHVNNVYGGNDISGNVYAGNTVGIMTHIYGNVYGGGNGSYAYTDNPQLKDDPHWSDFYYNPDEVLDAAGVTVDDDKFKSVTALNLIRPNAEKVSILVRGKEGNPTVVDGALYVGGNSASLREHVEGISAEDQTHIKIGSHVIIDNVFLGNNGENMIKYNPADSEGRGEGVLRTFARTVKDPDNNDAKFSQMDLTDKDVFEKYMEGCAMKVKSTVVFESTKNGDGVDYIPYSTYFGSFFCGGNVGSMITEGKTTINFSDKVIIYNKMVGGCNNANVNAAPGFNAQYLGGLLGNPDSAPEGTIGDKLELNLSGLKIQPMRWNDAHTALEWNTVKYNAVSQQFESVCNVQPTGPNQNIQIDADSEDADGNKYIARRLQGGNIYGGCYNSGHINGNVVININETLMERDNLFDVASDEGDILYENTDRGTYTITERNTGVILSEQGMDVLGDALNVFGGGYGGDSEIWGSATINLNKGYVFQIFGGGEMGAIGNAVSHEPDPDDPTVHILTYAYDPNYSTYINLNGPANRPGVARGAEGDSPEMAECEFIYGGAFEGAIAGNVYINLNNGRIFNSFAGSCNADIFGHTETYVGLNGFPWIRDHIYGGNDLGGSIKATDSPTFSDRIRDEVKGMVAETHPVSSYMEYTQGRVRNILGGCFGDYDYSDEAYATRIANKPYLHNAFINFRPINNPSNSVEKIFGAGEGFPGDGEGKLGDRDGDKGQDHSYVLIDIPDNIDNFAATEVFGAGAYNGLGMRYTAEQTLGDNPIDPNEASAIIDLMRGKIGAVYGGSYEEGVTRRTVVNVPEHSTIKIGSIFGGAYGSDAYKPCDVYEANVNYLTQSEDAYLIIDPTGENQLLKGAIYGGNNKARRTLYGKINISAPVRQKLPDESMTTATVYGAGCGSLTWNEYTEVNLNDGANVWEVYGGGQSGGVMSAESVQKYIELNLQGIENWDAAWTLGSGYDAETLSTGYAANRFTNLKNPLVRVAELDDRELTDDQKARYNRKYNTNVIIKKGAYVGNYAYGGGLGNENDVFVGSGDVYGTTYIALLGGTVGKDIYAAGTSGAVYNIFGAENYMASANAYIAGGTARNVYGGGWKGSVGYHSGDIDAPTTGDMLGETHVVIGIRKDQTDANLLEDIRRIKPDATLGDYGFYYGIPAIERVVYGGGEGGVVYGTSNVTVNNGYIGYVHLLADQKLNEQGIIVSTTDEGLEARYEEKVIDETYKDPITGAFIPNTNLNDAGNVFGGGYVVNSFVDNANVTMYGGSVRGSLYGGGELGPIGRGTMKDGATTAGGGIVNGKATIYKAGKTHVQLYDGHVLRNVFGGGRGRDSWGGDGTRYMDTELVATLDLKSKGYVFGQTEVDVYGGEVGTDDGVALGYGNVFGGGDIGCVYSAYDNGNGVLGFGKKNGARYDGIVNSEGYYYKYESGAYVTSGTEYILTEDCKVVVEPWCMATSAITINDTEYAAGDYVPTSALHYLGNKEDGAWSSLGKEDVNKMGVIIHNAVFAGGNTSPGSTEVYANTSTVFGNATASIHDVYNRDLISIGRGRVGGLYGDGNLTLVDGYRELNITNYGTDYYHITDVISLEDYKQLPLREAAYYEIRYKCQKECTDKNNKTYLVGSTITADEMTNVFDGVNVTTGGKTVPMIGSDGKPLTEYWVENGVCSRYAGRPMNTIQRADFCGVFGSRMVMQGAQDRVPEIVDYTNYTINRVREVSLNKKVSVRSADFSDARNKEHGNYFGIYSVVNYLGALTSDLDFHTAVRVTDNSDETTYKCAAGDGGPAYGTATYYEWKGAFHNERKRNNGSSHNKVALASGVYLELTNENGRGKDLYEKEWGLITGVVELDLINVQPGMGGGYVYAKNAHGIRSNSGKHQTILTALNTGAVTNKQFQYDENEATKKEWETSGNFIHSTQTIIDDCYNIGRKYHSGYNKPNGVPAHYWFIKGAVYVYDQYISAYTGSPNAFSEEVSIPLTITAASHGKMKLLNVQPNYYAYYSVNTGTTQTPLGENDKIEIRDKEYGRNDAITYWDYSQLTESEKKLFVPETYVVIADCSYITNEEGATPVTYKAGTVLLPSEYTSLKAAAAKKDLDADDGLDVETPYVHHVTKDQDVDFDFVFRSSNNVSHDTGYILTYIVDNPNQWNTWYTPKTGTSLTGKVDSEGFKDKTEGEKSYYEDGPTYTPISSGMYGQIDYKVGSIISKSDYDSYNGINTAYIPNYGKTPDDADYDANKIQAEFYPAYIVTAEVLETTNKKGTPQRLHKGATLAAEDYDAGIWSSLYNPGDIAHSSVAPAYVVTSTVQLSNTEYMYRNSYLTAAEISALKTAYPSHATEIDKAVQQAYYCTTEGKYGGNYYETGHNYRALAAYSAMSPTDRENFTFNYDALDLLIDKDYNKAEGVKYQYDSAAGGQAGAQDNPAHYSLQTAVDYTATYIGGTNLEYKADNGSNTDTDTRAVLTRTEYERLPNEQYYWAPITVSKTDDTYYVVKQTIVLGDTPYAAGQVIAEDTYNGLSAADKEKVASLTFTNTGTYYYCREGYAINASNYAVDDTNKGKVTDILKTENNVYTSSVPAGAVINSTNYDLLVNKQKGFSFQGLAPTETSTFFVARGSDIYDLSAEKIITVVYQYDYVESDGSGAHITPVSERHVLNIHINFKSGVPTVEDILPPDIILPGTSLSMSQPYVTQGAYEITGGGWKLFDTESDAESHTNGVEYTNSLDPLYLYQNGHYLAYYTKTHLGETYSNHVKVSVANYHDLKKVMDDKDHHYYIDHKEVHERLNVLPKIYINDYSESDENGLDKLKDLFNLSIGTELDDHKPLNGRVGGCNNLEFFLRKDIDHSGSWTSIAEDTGDDDPCFSGILHGDGHTISGLNNSLFGKLCGAIYNLGVTGTFTGAGIAEKGDGYMENCWISTDPNVAKTSKPVFGSPTIEDNTQRPYRIVNCYYLEDDDAANQYNNHSGTYGIPTRKDAKAFYNGEVAYDLNGFYLFKRYNDGVETADGADYMYWMSGEDKPQSGHYIERRDLCSSGYKYKVVDDKKYYIRYVEDRFADGDFIFAGGEIPTEANERLYTDSKTGTTGYYPIWPDDYLFFGQRLNYGYGDGQAHQELPSVIQKSNDRLITSEYGNRVYRAPAYFRSSEMKVAHFNPNAIFAQHKKDDPNTIAYQDMTAIDFTGGNGDLTGGYKLGLSETKFYPPLLDDCGLTGFRNVDLTQNLLAYTLSLTENNKTYTTVTGYLPDLEYDETDENGESTRDTYRTVVTQNPSSVKGHAVVLTDGKYMAQNDHFLVDKNDYNAPIEYTLGSGKRMWYQRTPDADEFVDRKKGWSAISLPFSAELVTTNQKGEITHFYEGSATSKNNTNTKIGHEYWLRQYRDITDVEGAAEIQKARMTYPWKDDGEKMGTKTVSNTFLWEYYYKGDAKNGHNHLDKNGDPYQEYEKEYYKTARSYIDYNLLTRGTPYIIGFPGATYYEFDLSGNFSAETTHSPNPNKIGLQTITFASKPGDMIRVSDTEKADVTYNGYTFRPSYLNEKFKAGTDYYTLYSNYDGNSSAYKKVPETGDPTPLAAFRPFFFKEGGVAGARGAKGVHAAAKYIIFDDNESEIKKEEPIQEEEKLENLIVNGGRKVIVVKSNLREEKEVNIVNVAGITLATFTIQPGETVNKNIVISGVYIVRTTDGRYTKKVLVR